MKKKLRRISFIGNDPTKRKSYKKYKFFVIFRANRFDIILSKEKEKRFRQIQKEIKKLIEEQDNLFKK